MRWIVTSHAVDRWRERVDATPPYFAARLDILAAMTKAERIGSTPRGQDVYRIDHPSHAVAIVKHPSQRRDQGEGSVVVTVLTQQQWHGFATGAGSFDEQAEILAAYEELQQQVPKDWTRASLS